MIKKIALVCIAKDEDYYIQEWIDYHLKLGFDDIHIFQNNWRFQNKIENENVHFHEYDGVTYFSDEPIWVRNIQSKCYTEFGRNHCNDYEWAAFFDVDEFLVLKEYDNVKDFINNYSDYNCLVINWALFGDNGITTFDNNYTSLVERFTKRWNVAHGSGYHQFKSICKLHKDMTNDTHWTGNGTSWVDPNFNIGDGPFNYNEVFNKAQLNHYYTKTYQEWIIKSNGTRCDSISLPLENFQSNNFNDVDDFYALEFLKK
jgi:hypothetical protein